MSTVCDSLLAISAYPIPMSEIEKVCLKREISTEELFTGEIASSREYRLAEADLMMWLSSAPNVSQGGQSYSLSGEDKADFRRRALRVYSQLGDADGGSSRIKYGYKGTRL